MTPDFEKRLVSIEERLEMLERILTRTGMMDEEPLTRELSPSVKDLLKLPDTLRRTLLALQSLGEATSEDVAQKTGRTQSKETAYLKQLGSLSYITRTRRGRKTFYAVARYY